MDLEGLARAILTCVTAGPGLGFNRAALFLADEDQDRLVATMAIGPSTPEEAHATWTRLATEQHSLDDLLHMPPPSDKTAFQQAIEGLVIALGGRRGGGSNPLLEAFRERRIVKISGDHALAELPPGLREVFDGSEVVCVPLVAKGRSLGLIVADNAFTREPIGAERIQLLLLLAQLAGLALDNARMYRQVERQASDLERAMAELRAAQEEVIHSERLATVGAVVARVSHEIRNPLATIGGFARALTAQPDDVERVRRNAEIILSEVTTLELLLKEMLDFTSPKVPRLEPVDLNGLVSDFVERHRGELRERGFTLRVDLCDVPPVVLADPHQLQRVLLNLWQNAIQAIEETVPAARGAVSLRTYAEDGRACFEIRDDGKGISPEDRARVFVPFFTTKRRGTGLGLAVVKKIVDDHRGTIDVDSQAGAGTSVRVRLMAGG